MRIYEEKVETITTNVIKEIECDICGKKTKYLGSDITQINIKFSYGSKFDREVWQIDLCDDCIETLFKNIKKKCC